MTRRGLPSSLTASQTVQIAPIAAAIVFVDLTWICSLCAPTEGSQSTTRVADEPDHQWLKNARSFGRRELAKQMVLSSQQSLTAWAARQTMLSAKRCNFWSIWLAENCTSELRNGFKNPFDPDKSAASTPPSV